MRITTRNLKAKRKMVKEAIAWYGERLLGKRLAKNISIHVIGYNSLINGSFNGLCQWTDLENRNPREFEIELNLDLSDKDLLTVIAHEMVHVRQSARRQMVDVWSPGKGYHVKWMGQVVPSTVAYRKLPWEKEAYALEKKLYKEYMKRG